MTRKMWLALVGILSTSAVGIIIIAIVAAIV